MINMPEIKLGIVAVSRDCFPMTLSENRRKAVVAAYDGEIYECPTVVESEKDMLKALSEVNEAGCDALVVYLGNFGPETAETLLVKYFDGPCMVVAAAEERGDNLVGGRGDAYCGMLNASYNLKLRNLHAYIPEYPLGNAQEVFDFSCVIYSGSVDDAFFYCSLHTVSISSKACQCGVHRFLFSISRSHYIIHFFVLHFCPTAHASINHSL